MAESDFTVTEAVISKVKDEAQLHSLTETTQLDQIDIKAYLDVINSLPEDIRSGVFKHAFRLLNNDPKVKRLTEMLDSGQISHYQFYQMM